MRKESKTEIIAVICFIIGFGGLLYFLLRYSGYIFSDITYDKVIWWTYKYILLTVISLIILCYCLNITIADFKKGDNSKTV